MIDGIVTITLATPAQVQEILREARAQIARNKETIRDTGNALAFWHWTDNRRSSYTDTFPAMVEGAD